MDVKQKALIRNVSKEKDELIETAQIDKIRSHFSYHSFENYTILVQKTFTQTYKYHVLIELNQYYQSYIRSLLMHTSCLMGCTLKATIISLHAFNSFLKEHILEHPTSSYIDLNSKRSVFIFIVQIGEHHWHHFI